MRISKTKFFPTFLTIILLDEVISLSTDVHKLTAVSSMNIAKILYQRIRKQDPYTEAPPAIDPDTKNRICYHVTGSTLFADVWEEQRVRAYEIGEKLMKEYPYIFPNLYELSANSTTDSHLVYTNQTRLVNVHLTESDEEAIEEWIFTCLTTQLITENDDILIQYFISREYNLSDTPNLYSAGRFIFEHKDISESRLIIVAVAEVPAKSLSTPGADVERSYLRTRANNEPAENHTDDPVCRLNEHERLRVCTLVLNSTHLREELKFAPKYEYVDESNCMKKEITFQDNQASLVADGKRYEEWMIGCRPEEYYASYQAEYFVSRVYNSTNHVFLYRRGRGSKLVLENLFGNVRFKI